MVLSWNTLTTRLFAPLQYQSVHAFYPLQLLDITAHDVAEGDPLDTTMEV
jgi:hypothetical protein